MTRKNKAIFLDRDGIINTAIREGGLSRPPRSLNEFSIISQVPELLAQLSKDFYLFIVTNQPDISNGKTTKDLVDQFHQIILDQIPQIKEILVCTHIDSDNCQCRKPKPGMLISAADKWGIDLSASYMIGDRWRDIGAGQNAGCKTLFVDYSYEEILKFQPDETFKTVPDALQSIILK